MLFNIEKNYILWNKQPWDLSMTKHIDLRSLTHRLTFWFNSPHQLQSYRMSTGANIIHQEPVSFWFANKKNKNNFSLVRTSHLRQMVCPAIDEVAGTKNECIDLLSLHNYPSIAQLVERWTVEKNMESLLYNVIEIHRSLVQLRLDGV